MVSILDEAEKVELTVRNEKKMFEAVALIHFGFQSKNYFKAFLSVVFNQNFFFWTGGKLRDSDNRWIWTNGDKYVNKSIA